MDLVEIIKSKFNNSSDLIIKNINKITIIYLESICDGDKINNYITKNIILTKSNKDIISGPNVIEVSKIDDIIFYLLNGFAIVLNKNNYAIEVRATLNRGVNTVDVEPSINGPKDSLCENIQVNLGLIKRRIKNNNLINEDYFLGNDLKTKISILYFKDNKDVKLIRDKINKLLDKNIICSSDLKLNLESNSSFPTIKETQRIDTTTLALLQNKIVILCDNSPFSLILPSFFSDFINPIDDYYQKSINVNFLKILRLLCLFITLFLPALYIALFNYNFEVIPVSLLSNFTMQRSAIIFPTYIEMFVMLVVCAILRESDIRFPSALGSSVSIVGALILGEAAVNAGMVSPIIIIICAFTLISSMIFNDIELINSLRLYRFIFLLFASLLGIYGLFIATIIFLINLCDLNILNKSYMYPISPYSNNYFFKTILKGDNK